MEKNIQTHILNNLKELNETVAAIGRGQEDLSVSLDKMNVWIKAVIERNQQDIGVLQRWQSVTSWKIGCLAAGAGAICSFAGQWLAIKLGFKI